MYVHKTNCVLSSRDDRAIQALCTNICTHQIINIRHHSYRRIYTHIYIYSFRYIHISNGLFTLSFVHVFATKPRRHCRRARSTAVRARNRTCERRIYARSAAARKPNPSIIWREKPKGEHAECVNKGAHFCGRFFLCCQD